MSDLTACASCPNTEKLKQCSRCKTVAYCSPACQRAHWQTHKPSCHFKVIIPPPTQTPLNDALPILRITSDPGTKQKLKNLFTLAQQTFNIPELRLSIFSLLPACDLLRFACERRALVDPGIGPSPPRRSFNKGCSSPQAQAS